MPRRRPTLGRAPRSMPDRNGGRVTMPERPNARRAVPARSRPLTQALVIGRRGKGRPIEEAVRETRKRLEGAGWTVESALEDRKRVLRKRAARAVKAEVDVVVAVGGDGAVLQLVQVLAETPVALGIIPNGTGNSDARPESERGSRPRTCP